MDKIQKFGIVLIIVVIIVVIITVGIIAPFSILYIIHLPSNNFEKSQEYLDREYCHDGEISTNTVISRGAIQDCIHGLKIKALESRIIVLENIIQNTTEKSG